MAVRKTLSVAQIKDIAGRLKTADINCLEVFVSEKGESYRVFLKRLFAFITGFKTDLRFGLPIRKQLI